MLAPECLKLCTCYTLIFKMSVNSTHKVVPIQAMKAYSSSGGVTPHIFKLCP